MRRTRWGWALLVGVLLHLILSGVAHAADPRERMKMAYEKAKSQFTDVELDTAIATLDIAIARAQDAELSDDPALAPLHILRGGIIFFSTGDRSRTIAAFEEAIRADYHVWLPIELRTKKLRKLLTQVRKGIPEPDTGPIVHTTPQVLAGEDIPLKALSAEPLTEGVKMVLWWRTTDTDDEYQALELETFGNLGSGVISASDHGDADLEYYIDVVDSTEASLANLGDESHPLVLPIQRPQVEEEPVPQIEETIEAPARPTAAKPVVWPRVYFNVGFGTGVGLSRGNAELTYEQYIPGADGAEYGLREQACAIERWISGDELTLAENSTEFTADISGLRSTQLPNVDLTQLANAYDAASCSRRQSVSTGISTAPLHIAPELLVRVYDRTFATHKLSLVVGAYGRLQVITGSRVYSENPNSAPQESFLQEVISPNPKGFRRRLPSLTWAAGLKFKAIIAKKASKFQGVVGVFGGYGIARLRANLGITNDRNGNSVPDLFETALSGPTMVTDSGEVIVMPDQCTPVWPYVNGCLTDMNGSADRDLAEAVRNQASTSDIRIDTVKIGPGTLGLLGGVIYQIHPHISVFAELNIGVWLPTTTSVLVDLNVGPAITF